MKRWIEKNKTTIIMSLFIFGLICFVSIKASIDPDYYFHIKAGRYMLDSGKILTHDIFSWVSGIRSTYWMSHEWLFEIIIACLDVFSYSTFIFSFVLIGILYFILYFINKNKWNSNVLFTMIWFILSIAFIFPSVLPRPQLFDFIFLALTLYFLYSLKENESSNKIYFIPIITLLWANLHGGSSNIPYLLILLFIISGLFNFNGSHMEGKRLTSLQLKKYIMVFILSIFVIVINPHGIKMLIYPYENMSNSIMISSITEWMPTNFNDWYHVLFYIFFGVNLLILLLSKKKVDFVDLVILGFTLFLGLKSIRFWMYFVVSSFVIICKYIPSYKIKNKDENYILIIVVLLLTISFSSYNKTFKNINKKPILDEVINTIKNIHPKRLYNDYNYGGYLIYNDIDVFVDGRADLYSKYNYYEYCKLSNLSGNFNKIISKYNFDYYLVSNNSGLNYYLKDKYSLVVSDKNVSLYKVKE